MKHLLLSLLVALLGIGAMVADPVAAPLITFTVHKKAGFKMSVYLKDSIAGNQVRVDWGDNTIDTLTATKANDFIRMNKSISITHVMTADVQTVKIYGNTTTWFVNFNSLNASDVSVCDGCPFYEFRCTGDSITDFSFLSKMPRLGYLVTDNSYDKNLVIKSATLQRLQLGSQPNVESLTLDCPLVYEFSFSKAPVTELDLSKLPALKTLNLSYFPNLTRLELKDKPALTTASCATSPSLKTVVADNLPLLTQLTLNSNNALTDLQLGNLPKLSKLSLMHSGLTSAVFKDMATLTYLDLDYSPLESFTIENMPALKTLYTGYSKLTTLDLSKVGSSVLTAVHSKNGELRHVILAPEHYKNLRTLNLQGNHIALVDMPHRPAKVYSKYNDVNYYAPQHMDPVAQSLPVGSKVDLSKYTYGFDIDSNKVASVISAVTIFGDTLVAGQDYQVTDGVFTFNKEIGDSVQLIVDNTAFPSFKRTVSTNSRGVTTVTENRLMTNYFVVEAGSLVGDINGDGILNVEDVTALVNDVLTPDESLKALCDLNADGVVNVEDVTALVNLVLQGGAQ